METFETIGTCYTKRYSMDYHRNFDDQLMKDIKQKYMDLAKVCALLGFMLGLVIGAATHHWWYHSF